MRETCWAATTYHLDVRHSVVSLQSNPFTSDDLSETSSDSSSDDLSDSSYGHSSSDHPSPALPSGMRSSHQLCSSVPSIPHSSSDNKRGHIILLSASPSDQEEILSSDSYGGLEDCSVERSDSSVLERTSLRDALLSGGSD
ncbi:hypothetical protein Tco_1067011 [Tanacetum coccineum]|uniref:Uncharacterized protein n=1 Tax=Tanacetum coccineum TaxID=301880 RepID=A0ABQ5HCI3_9ASTR